MYFQALQSWWVSFSKYQSEAHPKSRKFDFLWSFFNLLILRPVLQSVEFESDVVFHFKDCDVLNNPVLQLDQICFKYNKDSLLIFHNINIASHSDSRICIVNFLSSNLLFINF